MPLQDINVMGRVYKKIFEHLKKKNYVDQSAAHCCPVKDINLKGKRCYKIIKCKAKFKYVDNMSSFAR